MDRRGFIKTAVAGLAGLAGFHAIPKGAPIADYEPEEHAVPGIQLTAERAGYGYPRVRVFVEDLQGMNYEASGYLRSLSQHWPLGELGGHDFELAKGSQWEISGPQHIEVEFVVDPDGSYWREA